MEKMFERVSTKKHQPTLRYNGRWLSSSVDAVAEARQWVKHHLPSLRFANRIIVLGVGGGYHLAELSRVVSCKKILALDLSVASIEFCRQQHSLSLTEVQFLNIQNNLLWLQDAAVTKYLADSYVVLAYRPAWANDMKFYEDAHLTLLARNVDGMKLVSTVRGYRPTCEAQQGAISIKQVVNIFADAENISDTDLLVFSALRELVK